MPRIEGDGQVYSRRNSVNGLPNAAIQSLLASFCMCRGARRWAQSL